jgi:hypothetical protein
MVWRTKLGLLHSISQPSAAAAVPKDFYRDVPSGEERHVRIISPARETFPQRDPIQLLWGYHPALHCPYVILGGQQGDWAMDNDSDLQEERQTVVRRLLDAYFGRTARSEAKTKEDIVPMGGPTRSDKSLDQKSFETR